MNCFEFRRLVLAEPRVRTHEQDQHVAYCAACAAMTRELDVFEARIHDAARVPVPEGLAERVLLRHKIRAPAVRALALAASVVAALAIGMLVYRQPAPQTEPVMSAAALGEAHPAVAAIAYVVDNESRLLAEGRTGDPAVMRSAFVRLGLKLPGSGVAVRYLGECPVPGGSGEHVVLDTPAGHVTLILVPEQRFGTRVIVTDRNKTAIASPARTGGYILISDSLSPLERIEKLLI
jgi:hypothetical protein